MIDWTNPILVAPTAASIISIISFFIVFRAMLTQSWRVKFWLIVFMACWVPWSMTTVFMRLATSEQLAQDYLRASFLSLQLAYFSAYKFSNLLVFKTSDKRYSSFGISILVGFNAASAFDHSMLAAVPIGEFYTDSFSTFLQLTNIAAAAWSGYLSFKAMRELDLFSSFYTETGVRKPGQIILALFILVLMVLILLIWIAQSGPADVNPDSTLFIFLSWAVMLYFTIAYGLRPLSTILSPQRIWAFLLINAISGIPIYTKIYGNSKQTDFILFCGAMSAANVMMKIHLDSPSDVDLVTLADRAVMLSKQENLIFCLIMDHTSGQFEVLLNELIRVITSSPQYKTLNPSNPIVDTQFIDPIISDLLEV